MQSKKSNARAITLLRVAQLIQIHQFSSAGNGGYKLFTEHFLKAKSYNCGAICTDTTHKLSMSQYLVSECIAKEEKSKFKGHYSAENSSISSKFIINIEQLTRTN